MVTPNSSYPNIPSRMVPQNMQTFRCLQVHGPQHLKLNRSQRQVMVSGPNQRLISISQFLFITSSFSKGSILCPKIMFQKMMPLLLKTQCALRLSRPYLHLSKNRSMPGTLVTFASCLFSPTIVELYPIHSCINPSFYL